MFARSLLGKILAGHILIATGDVRCSYSKTPSGVSIYCRHKGERGGLVVESLTPERVVGGSIPTSAVLCP